MNPATLMLAAKLIDLAIAGGEYALRALAARDRMREMAARGGATPAELAALNTETDGLIERLRTAAARNAGV